MQTFINIYRRNFTAFLVLAMILCMLYAFNRNMLIDDSFISFRYAKNLVDGHGLVYNIDERVEGYSNFLWVMLLSFGCKLGIQPEIFFLFLAIPIYVAVLVFTYLLALKVTKSRTYSMIAMLLVGFNHSIACFAASGMETPLQMLEFLSVGFIIYGATCTGWSIKKTILLSLILSLSLLTRPDSIILAGCSALAWYHSDRKRKLIDYTAFFAPFVIVVLPWLIWKYNFYGSILPNSFNAKVRGFSGVGFGFYYFYLFVIYYALAPFIALVIWRWRSLYRTDRGAAYIALFALVWSLYVIFVGGDFMEFRFLTPIIPFIIIVVLKSQLQFISDKWIVMALTFALCLGTANNFSFINKIFFTYRVERVEELNSHLYAPEENWDAIGKKLGELFKGTDVTLGIGAAGVIPYYAGLKSIDFMGLTDKNVPLIGEFFSSMPGHRVIAPLEYMVNSGVNLVVQPIRLVFNQQEFMSWRRQLTWNSIYTFFLDIDKPVNGAFINEAFLLVIPIEKGYSVVVWYLSPHEAVEQAIYDHNLMRIRLTR
ncbi:hypothetical protein K9N50_04000 [bacterium]|nr:hypothetical protein [bacterium]